MKTGEVWPSGNCQRCGAKDPERFACPECGRIVCYECAGEDGYCKSCKDPFVMPVPEDDDPPDLVEWTEWLLSRAMRERRPR